MTLTASVLREMEEIIARVLARQPKELIGGSLMPMTKITVPPPPTQPLVVGEVDLDAFRAHGRQVKGIACVSGGTLWGHTLNIAGGCLIFVPSIRSGQIA